jgi:hypothetical protein
MQRLGSVFSASIFSITQTSVSQTNDMSNSTFGQIFYLEAPPTSLLGSGRNAAARMIQLKAQLQF